jgi:hypothetical protein
VSPRCCCYVRRRCFCCRGLQVLSFLVAEPVGGYEMGRTRVYFRAGVLEKVRCMLFSLMADGVCAIWHMCGVVLMPSVSVRIAI